VFNRKQPQAQQPDENEQADLIDLLLDADERTRSQLMRQAVRSGTLSDADAAELLAQVIRLERVAGPRTPAAASTSEPQTAWGIDYP
jgi:hypothetical protein